MYRIIKTDGTEIGLADSVRFIAKGGNGAYVEVKEQDAIGISFKGKLYALLGKPDLQEAEVVIVAKTSTADEIVAQRTVADITFVKLAESGELDETTMSEHVETFSPWAYPVNYVTGNIRQYGGKLYRCLQDHASQADWTPDAAPSLWVQIADPSEEWPAWSQPIGAHDAYELGAKVSHNGKKWVSDVASNVWEPGVYGWSEYTEDDAEQ